MICRSLRIIGNSVVIIIIYLVKYSEHCKLMRTEQTRQTTTAATDVFSPSGICLSLVDGRRVVNVCMYRVAQKSKLLYCDRYFNG